MMPDLTPEDIEVRKADSAEFRAFLAEMGESHGGFARTLIRLGDHRPKATIVRSIERMVSGDHKISGEMRVIMTVFRNSRRRRNAAQEAAQTNAAETIAA